MDYNNKIIRGSEIRGENLRIPRARAIFRAAQKHPYVRDVSCYVNSKCDEMLRMRLVYLEVPDCPVYDIREEEEIAIICHKEDVLIPEVYAIRKDFPVELPHSNALPYARPVSLCVSDVSFSDIRPQFNAYDFINYIRRWFNLNSLNQLHEEDRPLEIFFASHEVCCLLNLPEESNPYVRYISKSKLTSTLEFVQKSNASHYLVFIPTEKIYASNFARIPQTMGDLSEIKSSLHESLTDCLLLLLTRTLAGKAELPLMLMVFITQESKDGKKNTTNLFAIKTSCSPREIVAMHRKLPNESFLTWFSTIPVGVTTVIGMASRQENADNNGIKDIFSKVSFIGSGTLGASLIDHFVREGCAAEIAIADYDFLFPHNLSRHILTPNKVMSSKVRSIRDSYRGVIGQKISAIEGNVLQLEQKDKDRLYNNTQIVVDVSTSIAVERYLAHSSGDYRRCTAFLNPRGDEAVLMIEDPNRKNRLDFIEMDYYRNLLVEDKYEAHLEQPGKVVTNTFSCRAESSILNYENIRVLSAIISGQIRKYYFNGLPCLNLWHIDKDTGAVTSHSMVLSTWKTFRINETDVYLSSYVEEEIRDQSDSSDNETGGSLFGSYDRDYCMIYVYYTTKAPKDSTHTPASFIRGIDGLTKEYERITRLTFHQVRYLGEWHSHPNMANSPSHKDIKQFEILSEEQQTNDLPFVQIICGNNGLYVNAVM